jgi:hypothetical protein
MVLKLMFVANIMATVPSMLHWGLLISPSGFLGAGILSLSGTEIPHVETGLVYDARNSVNTNLTYIDLRTVQLPHIGNRKSSFWALQIELTLNSSRLEEPRSLHPTNRENGFHLVFGDCQLCTDWYTKALCPESEATTCGDQLFGKISWWFRDFKKTMKIGIRKGNEMDGVWKNCRGN